MSFRPPSYYSNFKKQISKFSKVNFYDTDVLCRLVSIKMMKDMYLNFVRMPLFENMVILKLMNKELNHGNKPSLYYWLDNHQNEI
jgi:predicted AAA+ superfamily ATPase